MIKYAEIDGYKNIGEIGIMSHVYQLIEIDKREPMIILIHAYEGPTKAFKGYLYNKTKKYKSVDLTKEEQKEIERFTGKLEQVDFISLIEKTVIEKIYADYEEM